MDDKSSKLKNRKVIRLPEYSYSENGVYFVTVCTKNKRKLFGTVVGKEYYAPISVGDGILDVPQQVKAEVIGYDDVYVKLSEFGKIVDDTLHYINENNDNITIDKYVIMPNHIHMIIVVDNPEGTSGMPSPTEEFAKNRPNELIPKLISSLKRFTNKKAGFDLWQRSYNDHVVRNLVDYERIWEYIDTNPIKWKIDKYYI
jgi:REP element-mobilizing transposase RayT